MQKHSRNRSVAEPVIIQKQENWEHSRNKSITEPITFRKRVFQNQEHSRNKRVTEPGTFQKQEFSKTRNIPEIRELTLVPGSGKLLVL